MALSDVQKMALEQAEMRGEMLKLARARRPRLTAETSVAYLDWLTANAHWMPAEEVAHHMQAAELAIRTIGFEAQNKATQHTLVDEGKIDQPNQGS